MWVHIEIEMGEHKTSKSPHDFWGELAPCENALQIYQTDRTFISTLAAFVQDGINSGDYTLVIATRQHISAIGKTLGEKVIEQAIKAGSYRPLDAKIALSNFLQASWPDAEKFHSYISGFFVEAKKQNRKVRAFGEMVALLWAQGNSGATVQLEHLWNEFCSNMAPALFCVYPTSGLTDSAQSSLEQICRAHARIVAGEPIGGRMLSYKPSAIPEADSR